MIIRNEKKNTLAIPTVYIQAQVHGRKRADLR